MFLKKVTVQTSNGNVTYENVRVVKPNTNDDVFGNLIENLRPEFEIVLPNGRHVTIEFNSVTDIVLR